MTLVCSVDCEERFHGCCTHPDGPDVDGSPMICEVAILCGECPLRYSRDLVREDHRWENLAEGLTGGERS